MLQEIIPIALILIIGFSVNLHVEQFINKKKNNVSDNNETLEYSNNNTSDASNQDYKYKLINRDTNVVKDPLTAPERRVESAQYQKLDVNEFTRGEPDSYQLVGILSNKDANKVYQLFGRRTYPGAFEWEYYIRGNDTDDFEFKYPIDTKNEIYDNTTVTLPISEYEFTVKLYNYDKPRYIP
jgi:hypothetical protein